MIGQGAYPPYKFHTDVDMVGRISEAHPTCVFARAYSQMAALATCEQTLVTPIEYNRHA
jgi:hypothetical protein